MIRLQGIETVSRYFTVSPASVWYARVLFLSLPAATTDGSKSFDYALVLTMKTYDNPENGDYERHYLCFTHYFHVFFLYRMVEFGWVSQFI
jgi:hypothetical protein